MIRIGDAWTSDTLELAEGLSRAYDSFVEDEDGGRQSRKPGVHASELGCPRKVVYSLTSTEKRGKIPKFWRQRFQFGKYIHQMIQDDFERMAAASGGRFTFEPEVRISGELQQLAKELSIESSCDGVFTFFKDVDDLGTGERPVLMRLGLEIKTESPGEYEKLSGPKPDHVRQGHLYMRLLDLPAMWFLYINKGNQNNTTSKKPYLVEFDPAIWASLEQEIMDRIDEAASNILPPGKESIACEFCPYAWACNPDILSKRRVNATLRRPTP